MMDGLKEDGTIGDWKAIAYDWRLSLDDILDYGAESNGRIYYSGDSAATSTPYIVQELRRLAASSKSGRVTVVAHSNGGLLAKRLMEKLGGEAATLVDKMIFVAVPQIGTPVAIPAGLHGYKQDHLFGIIVSKATARAFASTSPMAYHLLPSAGYFSRVGEPVVSFDEKLHEWIESYGADIRSADNLRAFLVGEYGKSDASEDTDVPIRFDDVLLSQADALHSELDARRPPDGIMLVQIAGWGVPTVKGVTYKKRSGGLRPEPKFTIDGDGTVVTPSALWIEEMQNVWMHWIDLAEYNRLANKLSRVRFLDLDHSAILEVNSLLDFIRDTIIGSWQDLDTYEFLGTVAPTSTNTRLRLSLHSPLTLDVFDDFGNHTGVSTTTGQIEALIPGTYYVQFGDLKYIFADSGTPLHIVMSGYDSGTFTFEIGKYLGDSAVSSVIFTDVPVTPRTTAKVDISSDSSSISDLQIDEDGDGDVDLSYGSATGQLNSVGESTAAPAEPASAQSAGSGGSIYASAPQLASSLPQLHATTSKQLVDVVPRTPLGKVLFSLKLEARSYSGYTLPMQNSRNLIIGILTIALFAVGAWLLLGNQAHPLPLAQGDAVASWDWHGPYKDGGELEKRARDEIARLEGMLGGDQSGVNDDPTDYILYVSIANQHELLGDGKSAYDYLGKALKIDSEKTGLAWHNLGSIMERLGAYGTARIAYARAVGAQPQAEQYHMARLRFLMKNFSGDSAAIEAAFMEAEKQFGADAPFLVQLKEQAPL